jgi:hypothetical protein
MTAARAGMAARPRHQLFTWRGVTPASRAKARERRRRARSPLPWGSSPGSPAEASGLGRLYGWAKPKSREFPSDCGHFAACHAFVRHGNHDAPGRLPPATHESRNAARQRTSPAEHRAPCHLTITPHQPTRTAAPARLHGGSPKGAELIAAKWADNRKAPPTS